MTQDPRQQWGPQPPQPGLPPQPGQPPQPGGYPGQPTAYSPQGAYQPPPGYPPSGYPPSGYPPPGGGYPPQGGWGSQGPGGGGPLPGPPAKKSPLKLLLIAVAALVLIAAVGAIIMAFSRDGGDQPGTTITPGQPSAPPTTDDEPTPSAEPSGSSAPTGNSPTPGSETTTQPGGKSIDLSNGIGLTPASGWQVEKTGKTAAQLSDGNNIFLGQSVKVSANTNAGQLCTSWHKDATKGTSGGKFSDPKDANVGTTKLKAATCVAQTTVSSGQGTATIFLLSLASVRQSDGVTIIGTVYFTEQTSNDKLSKDFTAMVNSMLQTQSRG